MQFTTEAASFKKALSTTCRVIERSAIPILSHVRLNPCSVTASDMDMELTMQFGSQAVQDGECVVPAKALLSLIPAKSHIDFCAKEGKLTIEAADGTSSLTLGKLADFPQMQPKAISATIPGAGMSAAFASVKHAISTEETRYYLNGVCLRTTPTALDVVATDGHRLTKTTLPAVTIPSPIGPGPIEYCPKFIIPRKAVLLMTPFGDPDTVDISEVQATFHGPNWTLRTKLIDGTFPDYERVIPTTNDKIVTFNGPSLAKALPKPDNYYNASGCFTFNQDKLTIEHKDTASGLTTIRFIPCSYSGDEIVVKFNLPGNAL